MTTTLHPPLFPGAMALSNEAYHGDTTRISKSGLDLIHRSPAHYYARYISGESEKKSTEALRIGSACHTAVLEPDVFNLRYYTLDDSEIVQEIGGAKPRSTNKYKEWLAAQQAANAGKEMLSAEDYLHCIRVRDAVWAHSAARQLIKSGYAEQTFFFTEAETGAPCKMRLDFLNDNAGLIVDLKTTEDASPQGFARSVLKYRYHVQSSFYLDGFFEATGQQLKAFIFIAVEKMPPYAVGVYYVPRDILLLGRTEYQEDCAVYVNCLTTGTWPAYSDIVTPLQLPAWVKNRN